MRTPVYILIFAGRVEKNYPLPRGEGGPAKPGRERNSGRNPKVCTNEQTSSQAKVQEEVFRFP